MSTVSTQTNPFLRAKRTILLELTWKQKNLLELLEDNVIQLSSYIESMKYLEKRICKILKDEEDEVDEPVFGKRMKMD